MKLVDKKLQLCFNADLQLYEEYGKYYVDAKDLWKWLCIKTPFSKWFSRRIIQYKFETNEDYQFYYYKEESIVDLNNLNKDKTVSVETVENTQTINCQNFKKLSDFKNENQASKLGYEKKYFLNPDMAKQLAMVEDADKGKLVREFYLNLEKYIQETNQVKQYYDWVDKRTVEAHETYEFYNLIGDEGKCIALSRCLQTVVSYKFNFPFRYNKEQIFQLSLNTDQKEPWLFYQEVKESAETYVKYFMRKDKQHFMHNVIDDILNEFIDDIDKYEEYRKTHTKGVLYLKKKFSDGKTFFGRINDLRIE